MSYKTDMLKIIKRAEMQGWRHQKTSSGHHQFFAPPPSRMIIVASGTSCNNTGWRRFLADMKKAGLKMEDEEMEKAAEDIFPQADRPKIHVIDYVRDFLRNRETEAFSIDTLHASCAVYYNGIERQRVKDVVSQLFSQAEIHGVQFTNETCYQWGQIGQALPPNAPLKVEYTESIGLVTAQGQSAESVEIPDLDETALNRATSLMMEALSIVETVVARQKKIAKARADLKKLLLEE
jgi:hypothetical protein